MIGAGQLLLALMLLGGWGLAQTASGRLVLVDGTPVKLSLTRTMTSAGAKKGERVDFVVLEDVRIQDYVVVPKGAIAWATVTEVETKRRMARGGKLDINIDAVKLLTGQDAPLRAIQKVRGGGKSGQMAEMIGATSLMAGPFGAPFVLLMHGKDIHIWKGTEVTAYVNGDFSVDATRLREANVMHGASGASAPAILSSGTKAVMPATAPLTAPPRPISQAGPTAVEVVSTPTGADIELDGRFVGNTPSTLQVEPGEHTLTIKKAGFRNWQRNLTTAGGNVRVTAELESEKI